MAELPSVTISGDWDTLFTGRSRSSLESALPAYLTRQRWFGGKSRAIQSALLVDEIDITRPPGPPTRLLFVEVRYVEGDSELYTLPVVIARGDRASAIIDVHPRGGILRLQRDGDEESAMLCEALWEESLWRPLYDAIAGRRVLKGKSGEITAEQTRVFRLLAGPPREHGAPQAASGSDAESALAITVHGGEQSNTSVTLENRFVLKLIRRLTRGENPDLEIGRFLTEKTRLSCVPRLAGALVYRPPAPAGGNRSGEAGAMTLGILHELVPNEGDAWVYTLGELGRYVERIESTMTEVDVDSLVPAGKSLLELAQDTPPDTAREMIGAYLESARQLGRRTAEVHRALASGTDEAFAPEAFSLLYQRSLYRSMRTQTRRAFQLLARRLPALPDDARGEAERVARAEDQVLARLRGVMDHRITAMRIRCHGDYHLGQVLFTGRDFVVIDFEGEPARPMSERRTKTSPLRDVAGMIRSLHYASHAARRGQPPGESAGLGPRPREELARWLRVWYSWTAAAFLGSYLAEAGEGQLLPSSRDQLETLLNTYLLEKAVYELAYELDNRPEWVGIPLEGIVELLAAK